jgi:putative Holliday junction resolvase
VTRALGLDLGTRRIGLAVSDAGGVLASPYGVIERSGDEVADHRRILEAAAQVGAEHIVVGLPLSLDGSVGPAAEAALAEVERLGATTDLPLDTYDERFTTVTADRYLRANQLTGKKASKQASKKKGRARREVIDQTAAAVMLQAWLDGRPRPTDDPTPRDPA